MTKGLWPPVARSLKILYQILHGFPTPGRCSSILPSVNIVTGIGTDQRISQSHDVKGYILLGNPVLSNPSFSHNGIRHTWLHSFAGVPWWLCLMQVQTHKQYQDSLSMKEADGGLGGQSDKKQYFSGILARIQAEVMSCQAWMKHPWPGGLRPKAKSKLTEVR